jgi:Protein of unknown function (DUF2752)
MAGHSTIVAVPCARSIGMCLAVAMAILIFAFDPTTTWWFPSCPLHALTGLLCPLCGSLRALHALLAGSPVAAFFLNPLTTSGAVAGFVARVHDIACPTRAPLGKRLAALCVSTRGVALVITFGMVRNVNVPFEWLVH